MTNIKIYPNNVGYGFLAYQNVEVVEKSLTSALEKFPGTIYVLDNASFDERTSTFLYRLAQESPRIKLFKSEKNLGCHRGFEYLFNQMPEDLEFFVKADDSFMCPVGVDQMINYMQEHYEIAFMGTNFFSDGRVNAQNSEDGFISWKGVGVPNLPWAILRTDFLQRVGFHISYVDGSGNHRQEDSRLYGGEEAYWAAVSSPEEVDYGYWTNSFAIHVGNEVLNPVYMLWKYMYGYTGELDMDFVAFREDVEAVREGFQRWLVFSENGMHQKWAKEWLEENRA